MEVRRYVTGESKSRSKFIEEGLAPLRAFETVPGLEVALGWATSRGALAADPEHGTSSIIPALGETRLLFITFPPDAVMHADGFDPIAAAAEYAEKLPGLADTFEPDHPGMHKTSTIDYVIVLDGEVWLELDDGEVRLGPGDLVVQRGTRHAWRNKSPHLARLAVILIGAA